MIQQDFYDAADDGQNIFLTGIGGSGKSYAVEKWKADNRKKKIVTVAPTGIAAINVGGATIHSTFKLPFGVKYFGVSTQKVDWDQVDVLVIDEISMVGSYMLQQLDCILQRYADPDKPFGGLQVIVVGDMAQLPPIITNQGDHNFISEKFGGVEFHNATAYKEGNFTKINLTESKRSHDNKLNDALNKIREGQFDINDFQTDNYSTFFSNRATHLMPYNAQVDRFNKDKLTKLPGKEKLYKATIKGNFSVKNVLSPENLEIKTGAVVMITKNMVPLVNGDMGEIVGIPGTNEVKFKSFRLNRLFNLVPITWEDKRIDENGNEELKGTFTQIPIKLGWAITIHKSQGLTLEKVVLHYNKHMDIPSIYVGLSRAVTWKDLYINKL